jgi:hypothetical protein
MNHAVHMTAVTQIRYQHSKGRAYYDKKIAEGKTSKEGLRALKRQVSDALYKRMKADARRAAVNARGPRGHPGNGSVAAWPACTPQTGSSARPLPGLASPYDRSPVRPRARVSPAPGPRLRIHRIACAPVHARSAPRTAVGLGLPTSPTTQQQKVPRAP